MGALGEMWDEHAVQAPFGIVATKTGAIDGVKRTMIGGVVFDDFGGEQWERWRGTMILIPAFIDVTRQKCGWGVQDLMLNGINRCVTAEEMRDRDSFWKSKWRIANR